MRLFAVLFWLVLASMALALDPAEMLDDPGLEKRARELDHMLRCVVCQSESVASSNATWAVEARSVIREQVEAGASDKEIVDFFVERYGEFVLMTPRTGGSNWLLWAAGPLMLLFAGGIGIAYLRERSRQSVKPDRGLSDQEASRLREILDE